MSDRPKSMREAFERVEASQTPAPPAPAATAQPGVTPAAVPTGPIPLDVHTKALENARTKAVTEYRQKYGWAESVPKQQFDQIAQEVQRAATDPLGYTLARIEELPPPLRAQLNARLGIGQPTPAQTSLEADVEVMGQDGRVIGKTFSEERVRAVVAAAVQEAIGKEVQPLKTAYEQTQAKDRQQQLNAVAEANHQEAAKIAEAGLEEVKGILDITDDQDPLFNDVLQVWTEHPEWSVHKAAIEVKKNKVAPRQAGQADQRAISEFQRKAAGNTANGRGTTATPAKPRTREELRQWMEANDAG
jgi:hypothetical protein